MHFTPKSPEEHFLHISQFQIIASKKVRLRVWDKNTEINNSNCLVCCIKNKKIILDRTWSATIFGTN